jgi:hypothetical protein
MALNGMVHQWDGDADNGDADTVAKLLKCHAINFPQIDQTRAVDLTFAAPGRPPCSERGGRHDAECGLGGTDHGS